jgi:hypothetical protein
VTCFVTVASFVLVLTRSIGNSPGRCNSIIREYLID